MLQAATASVPLVAYVVAFLAAAVACFASLARLSTVEHADTRRGLAGLLVTSGLWASAHVVFLAVPVASLRLAAYYVGLVVGFAAVGAWLYFCSAYTGRGLHRNVTYRRLAVAVFGLVVALKLTNPVHGFYLSTTVQTAPFPHLAVEHHLLHWLAMGLSYTLSAVGAFMILEMFTLTDSSTRPLTVLLGLMGLPLAFDVLGRGSDLLVDMTYEPLGVAVFAVGVLVVFPARFQMVRLAGDVDDPVIVLGEGGVIRDVNTAAIEVFPSLADAVGARLEKRLPDLAGVLDADDERVLQLERDGEICYFLVSTNPLSIGNARLGRMVVVSDITREERYRRQIERQNERLGQLASVLSHDLRNPLNVAAGRLELERNQRDSENLDAAAAALGRMRRLIENLLTLAQEGLDIGDQAPVSLATLAEDAWETVDTGRHELVVAGDLAFQADPDRLRQALENLFRNSVEHSENEVTVTVGPLADESGFYVEDDGPGIPPEDREWVLEFGESGSGGSGLGLAIVDTIAQAQGWRLGVTESATGGARFEFVGVEPVTEDEGEPDETGIAEGWEQVGGEADS